MIGRLAGKKARRDVAVFAQRGDNSTKHQHDAGKVDPEHERDDQREGVSDSAEAFGRVPLKLPDVGSVVGKDLLRHFPQNARDDGSGEGTSLARMRLRDEIVKLKEHRRGDEKRHEQPHRLNCALPSLADPRLVEAGEGENPRAFNRLNKDGHADRNEKQHADLEHHSHVEQVPADDRAALMPVLLKRVADGDSERDKKGNRRQKQADSTNSNNRAARHLQLVQEVDDLCALVLGQKVVDEARHRGKGVLPAQKASGETRCKNHDWHNRHQHFKRNRLCPQKQVFRCDLLVQTASVVERMGTPFRYQCRCVRKLAHVGRQWLKSQTLRPCAGAHL